MCMDLRGGVVIFKVGRSSVQRDNAGKKKFKSGLGRHGKKLGSSSQGLALGGTCFL